MSSSARAANLAEAVSFPSVSRKTSVTIDRRACLSSRRDWRHRSPPNVDCLGPAPAARSFAYQSPLGLLASNWPTSEQGISLWEYSGGVGLGFFCGKTPAGGVELAGQRKAICRTSLASWRQTVLLDLHL